MIEDIFKKILGDTKNNSLVDKDMFKVDFSLDEDNNEQELVDELRKAVKKEAKSKKSPSKHKLDLSRLKKFQLPDFKKLVKEKDESNNKDLASDNKKKIDKKLRKDKNVAIDKLISKRYYSKGSNGHYTDDDAKMSIDEYDGEQEVEIPSTAIADVKYDPKTKVCYVKYVKGNKWYKFINMSPQQFKTFMNASSKGRYVQFVMRKKNYDPSFRK